MLSDNYQSPSEETYLTTNQRNYKKSDIFFLESQQETPRRTMFDRNRSSVFDADPVPVKQPSRPNRLNSDIFFFGKQDSVPKFGDYEPSMSAPRRTPSKVEFQEAPAHDFHSEMRTTPAVLDRQEPERPAVTEHVYEQAPISQEQETPRKHVISSVFEPELQEQPFRGSRRHYANAPASDIFHRSVGEIQASPMVSAHEPAVPDERKWVPSLKQTRQQTTFSNLFGDWPEIDRAVRNQEPRRTKTKELSHAEKLTRVSGLSSEDLNRTMRGKSRKVSGTGSQIWF